MYLQIYNATIDTFNISFFQSKIDYKTRLVSNKKM